MKGFFVWFYCMYSILLSGEFVVAALSEKWDGFTPHQTEPLPFWLFLFLFGWFCLSIANAVICLPKCIKEDF